MSDEPKSEEQKQPESGPRQDWNEDNFPTSARKVFLGWGVMIGGIILLCFVAYVTSEHPVDAKAAAKKAAHTSAALGDSEDD